MASQQSIPNTHDPSRAGALPASIEVSPKQALESPDLPGLFPKNTRVYITDIGIADTPTLVAAARRIHDLGYRAVPHFASRRLTTRDALEDRIKSMTQTAGVTDILVIGGGLDKPAGEFSSTMDVLETGFLDKHGISHVGIAGHPEGSLDFSAEVALDALRMKQEFANRTDVELRIVTQFGFDGKAFANWAGGLAHQGLNLPVHIGVAGPAKITTLVKYATSCGVGNSLQFLKKQLRSVATLAKGFSPEQVVGPLETHVGKTVHSTITQLHVFPFGGIKSSANWLYDRGSWHEDQTPPTNQEGARDDDR